MSFMAHCNISEEEEEEEAIFKLATKEKETAYSLLEPGAEPLRDEGWHVPPLKFYIYKN